MGHHHENVRDASHMIKHTVVSLLAIWWLVSLGTLAMASHQDHESHSFEETSVPTGPGHPVPGAPFQVFLDTEKEVAEGVKLGRTRANEAIHTVVGALSFMVERRTQYARFDEALTKGVLQQVIIEPKVLNRDGKEFSFLVARTKHKGQVKLLISASALEEKGYLNQPEKLVPVLAREFQWVISKAATSKKRKTVMVKRELKKAPIRTNKAIRTMSGEEREHILQTLFQTYLTTVDDYQSLTGQPFYEVGSTTPTQPTQPDSTMKLYDIRVREALQLIVRDPYFQKYTPKAVRSLLNGKIWNVSFAKIDERDWATRTRVLPKDKAVAVGEQGKTIQPAKILLNYHRTAAPEDPFFSETNGLPMGALSADQLAHTIAWEIQNNIIDKSMRGHVAQDEVTAPQ